MTTKKKTTRCTGNCCRSFGLSLSPTWIKENYALPKDDPKRDKDIDTLYGMLIYLGQFPVNPIQLTHGESWIRKALDIARLDDPRTKQEVEMMGKGDPHFQYNPDPRGAHWYACRHLSFDGDCTIYEKRPHMCRVYPNGRKCEFAGCTWSESDQAKASFGRPDLKPLIKIRKSRSGHMIELGAPMPLEKLEDLSVPAAKSRKLSDASAVKTKAAPVKGRKKARR